MAKNQKLSRVEQEKADLEKMQKRVESLLPPKADLPASISIQQAEELQTRIRELEAKLLEQQAATNQVSPTAVIQPLSAQSSLRAPGKAEETSGIVEGQKQIALWVARIFTGVGLAFFGFSMYTLLVSQGGQVDFSDIALMPVTILMVIVNLIGLRLIRNDRYDLGVWAMYLVNVILPPIAAAFSTQNIYILIGSYLIIFSLLFISLVIPRTSAWKAISVASATALIIVAIEIWDPGFRVSTNHLETFTPVAIVLTLLAVFAIFINRAVVGNIRAKLLVGFMIVAFIASLTGVFTIQQQSKAVEKTSVEEATNIADTLAQVVAQGQVDLQELVVRFHESQQKDMEVVSPDLVILADANPDDVGTIFADDQNGEVASTLQDGQPRTYVEISDDYPEGIKLVVVPVKDNSGKILSAVILEYTPLFNELQQAQNIAVQRFIFLSLAVLLLAFVIAQFISTLIARPISQLSDAALKIGSGQLDAAIPAIASKDEVGILANAFTSMTLQLQGLFGNLEKRVQDRTHDLELASEVGRTIAEKVENTSAMLTDATEMIRSRFNLYYTQVYLLDPSGQTINLHAGTGDVGQQLLNRGHRLFVGSTSLNGRAVSEKKPIIVADTEKSGTFLPNPLLPKTRSEMAIPLLLGNKVLGVLDMQSETPNALNEENVASFQVLAGQLSVAIQNATLLAQSEEARKQMEDNVRQIATSGWQDYLNGTDRGEKIGYVFDQTEVKPIELKSKAQAGNALSIPITVTGATVGSIQVAQDEREWTSSETLVIQSTADQLAQHIENLRLLSQAEKYRQEAEQTTRRLTRESWEDYLKTRSVLASGYSFNPNEIKTDDDVDVIENDSATTLSRPIKIRDEAIGELMLQSGNFASEEMDEIFSAVATQLGEHIENLRLFETTQNELVERTRAEKELLKVRLGMDRTNDAVFITETDGTIIYVNPAFERIYGWTAKEAIGQTPRILKSGVIPAEQYVHFWGALKNNQVVAGEIVNKTKDGRLIPIEGNNNPIVDADGEIIGFLGMHRDITERKIAQEIIAQRANQLETVATVSSTAANVLDPDKLLQAVVDLTKERFHLYHTHIYLFDDAWQTLLLAAGAGEIGQKMVADGWNIPINHIRSIVANAARTKQPVIANNVHRDKSTSFLSNNLLPDTRSEIAVPMIVGDKVIGVFDAQADTADHFTDEDAKIYTTLASQVAVALQNARLYVEQAATVTQLRELDRLKSSFLANMSHELRTPLNSILGFADVMLEELDGPLTENMATDLSLIHKNGQHLLHLINDVLDMAKIDSGKMNLNVEKFNIHELLTDVTDITSSLAKEKSLALVIDADSDREVEINADKIRLRQVMINLVNNAMKFTEKGQVTIHVVHEEYNILISVKDTGIGIPADHLESVFQEFTQVDTTTTRKAGGTGLGLPISRRLINMHSGRLWAESTGINGEGSTFYVHLPIEAKINENASLAVN